MATIAGTTSAARQQLAFTTGKGYFDSMKVEIDIYSGRPNPSWELTEQEGRELRARLQALPATAASELPDKLGYRGLRIAARALPGDDSAAHGDRIVSIELGGGAIRLQRRTGKLEYFSDTKRSVECWLLATAQGRTDETIRQAAMADIGPECH